MANAVSSSIGRYCHSKNKTLEHTKNQSHIYFNVFLKKKKKKSKVDYRYIDLWLGHRRTFILILKSKLND